MDVSLKNVASKTSAAARVMSARPRPAQAQREQRQDDGDRRGQRGPDEPAEEQVQAEVVGQLGRREGAHPGQRGLAQRELARHAR